MTNDEIRRMFRDAAELRKLGPLSPGRKELEARCAEARARYEAECLDGEAPAETAPAEPVWSDALKYLGGLLQSLDAADPSTAPANQAVWQVIAPAVKAYYSKDGEPAE